LAVVIPQPDQRSELQPAVFLPDGGEIPDPWRDWLAAIGMPLIVRTEDELMALALRARPRAVLFDATKNGPTVLSACSKLKSESFTGVVPAVVLVGEDHTVLSAAFAAGADEVIRRSMASEEVLQRLDVLLARSDRDTSVHPSTRLPGTHQIEAEITRRIGSPERFAVCYADLDHFKEFNDRYSYTEGDRVIRMVARLLRDVVKGVCGETGFIGHIGGDDFIFIIPASRVTETCSLVTETFDLLGVLNYSERDRQLGYFMGKDRRGKIHRVPLMTISIGVVTNERRRFTHAGKVSALASEMKAYAKSLSGSVHTVDRRSDEDDRHPPESGREGSDMTEIAEIE
jgi:diguanylate cyclase (GGDEF)-like protein